MKINYFHLSLIKENFRSIVDNIQHHPKFDMKMKYAITSLPFLDYMLVKGLLSIHQITVEENVVLRFTTHVNIPTTTHLKQVVRKWYRTEVGSMNEIMDLFESILGNIPTLFEVIKNLSFSPTDSLQPSCVFLLMDDIATFSVKAFIFVRAVNTEQDMDKYHANTPQFLSQLATCFRHE